MERVFRKDAILSLHQADITKIRVAIAVLADIKPNTKCDFIKLALDMIGWFGHYIQPHFIRRLMSRKMVMLTALDYFTDKLDTNKRDTQKTSPGLMLFFRTSISSKIRESIKFMKHMINFGNEMDFKTLRHFIQQNETVWRYDSNKDCYHWISQNFDDFRRDFVLSSMDMLSDGSPAEGAQWPVLGYYHENLESESSMLKRACESTESRESMTRNEMREEALEIQSNRDPGTLFGDSGSNSCDSGIHVSRDV
ncbi:MAG: hypothetical protein JSS82_12570 [Bacteroidetes bacterium]|nr:hypothetical protein [Bacteroidota bacterium]